jgi:hypothetical protein
MNKISVLPLFTAGVLLMPISADPAQAVVYCKTVGVPKGCVVRPAPVVVVAPAPVVRRAVVRTTPVNLGGPVNRVGVR